MLKINTLKRLDLGIKDENRARDIYIDVKAWLCTYPNGSISIWHKRNGDQTKYATGATLNRETGILTWTPTAADTFYVGEGVAEIRLTENNVIKKTKDVVTITEQSIVLGSGETPTSTWQGYISTMEGFKNGAEQAKGDAEGFAKDAEAWAKGTRSGTDVESTDPAYHNNAEYWAGKAAEEKQAAQTAKGAAETAQGAAEAAQTAAERAQQQAESAVEDISTDIQAAEDAKDAAEAAQAAAEDAQEAAEAAQAAAEDAQEAAETAQGKAEDAQTAAESAQAAAEDAKDAAVTAKNAAEGAKDDAVTAKQAAESAKDDSVSAKNAAVSAKDDAVAAKEAAEAAMAHYPYVNTTTGTWMVWNPTTGQWTDTEVPAQGATGAVPNIQPGTVTTLAPDQNATVTRREGSPDSNPIFDFGIPQGQTGQAENVYGSTVPMSESDSTKVKDAIEGKADLVGNGTEDNFAALDANGNLKDSGKKAANFAASDHTHSGKADKVSGGTANNFAALDSSGNLKDSGKKESDFAASDHTHTGKADKVQNATTNNFAALDANGNLKDSGKKAADFAIADAGVPTGGNAGYYLVKTGSGNYAAAWCNPDTVPMPTSPRLITSDAVATVDAKATRALNSIASEYDPTATYKKGALIFYENGNTVSLMRCTGTTTGSFDLTKWATADIGEAIQSVQESVEALIDDTAGAGDTDVTLSADKITEELGDRDTAIAAVAGSVSIPVNGNTAPAAIASGKYINLTGHSTLADGEYITTAAIAASESITSSNVDPVSDGVANDLNSNMQWEDVSLSDFFNSTANIETSSYVKRRGKEVYVYLLTKFMTVSAKNTALVIKSAYLPNIGAVAVAINSSNEPKGYLYISNVGNIIVTSNYSNERIISSFTYMLP